MLTRAATVRLDRLHDELDIPFVVEGRVQKFVVNAGRLALLCSRLKDLVVLQVVHVLCGQILGVNKIEVIFENCWILLLQLF